VGPQEGLIRGDRDRAQRQQHDDPGAAGKTGAPMGRLLFQWEQGAPGTTLNPRRSVSGI
jgi:hypothetical protein